MRRAFWYIADRAIVAGLAVTAPWAAAHLALWWAYDAREQACQGPRR